ncbi:MAG: hypothetical protein N4A48_07675 [Tepidibacter sp.]|jgi:hypothetical protein|nr:hypothetical protein [Tepidibacter sp.]MCT4508628.1 hypothetical protein [Tepidibacter sp.]
MSEVSIRVVKIEDAPYINEIKRMKGKRLRHSASIVIIVHREY